MQVKSTDIFDIRTLAKPVANGDQVFFVETTIDAKDDAYYTAIKRYDRATGRTTTFGTGNQHDNNPQLSPDAVTLAFTTQDATGKMQVFTQPVAGGSATQLTHELGGVSKYAWAADGQSVFAQTKQEPAANNDGHAHSVRVTKLIYKANGRGLLPEGVTYALVRQSIDANERSTELFRQAAPFSLDAVSPVGDQVAVTMAAHPEQERNSKSATIIYDFAAGTQTIVLTPGERSDFTVDAFSPDGTRLLLHGDTSRTPLDQTTRLYLYDLAARELTAAPAPEALEVGALLAADTQQNQSGRVAAWTTNTDYVTVAFERGAVEFWTGTADTKLSQLGAGQRHVTDYALTTAGSGVYFTLSEPTVPSQLWYRDLATGIETLLADPNTEYEMTHDIVAPTEFSFERAGFTLQGWYFAPTSGVASHPASLYIHGGPHAGYGYSFYHELQYQANAGYGVITLNPRGGAGYGNDFKTAVVADYGGNDYADLLAGVDEALRLDPTIDPQRLYVTGGSYGGFMTNWIETHTTRFRAAATSRSISNWISFIGTSDIGTTFGPREILAQFDGDARDYQELWRFSPLAYVQNAVTPILILHGEEDYRCPIPQAEEFYTALKLAGVETEFIRFPKSNHELSRAGIPELRVERMMAIVEWFDRH